MKCNICNNDLNNEIFIVNEMMFGYDESFRYFECSSCGCLQLLDIPSDLKKYYIFEEYYSFKKSSTFKQYFKKEWTKYALFKKGLIGKFLNFKYKKNSLDVIGHHITSKKTKILDVGCGSGDLVISLRQLGYKNVLGIDPFIEDDFSEEGIEKKTIEMLPDSKKFDLIIFDQSFEHIPQQQKALDKVSKLLSDSGVCIIGIPLKNDYIWNLYDVNWVAIDAPRHFFLHTMKSFETLVNNSGLSIENIKYTSTEFLFLGSEQYKKGIILTDPHSFIINPKKSIFTKDQIQKYKSESDKLNEKGLGDSAIFVLRKP